MKKLLGIVVLGLLWCNVGFTYCIEGDCHNGQGTYTYPGGRKHVGEWEKGRMFGVGTIICKNSTSEIAGYQFIKCKPGRIIKGIWDFGMLEDITEINF